MQCQEKGNHLFGQQKSRNGDKAGIPYYISTTQLYCKIEDVLSGTPVVGQQLF